MKTNTIYCELCGGTIGPIEFVEQLIIAPTIGNQPTKFTEVWFNCIKCEADLEPSHHLIDIIL